MTALGSGATSTEAWPPTWASWLMARGGMGEQKQGEKTDRVPASGLPSVFLGRHDATLGTVLLCPFYR